MGSHTKATLKRKPAAQAAQTVPTNKPPISYVFKPEVLERCGMTYPTLWAWMRAGKFPKSYDVGGRVAWIESEFDEWMATRPERKLKAIA